MNKLKVLFIGGLTNGKIVYDYLVKNKYVNLQLVISYSDNTNKPRFIQFPDGENIIKSDKANDYIEKIKQLSPDLIFVVGWSELLKEELLNIPQKGVIGFHPAKLPRDRGRSVLAWQIEEGYTETALTMFYYNNIPDGGDIIAQETIKIEENDYIGDVLNKIDYATYNIVRAYFPLLRQGIVPRQPQDLNKGNFRRLRTDRDSLIDWNQNAVNIYNKIRAISKPYPGAFTIIENEKVRIWKSEIINRFQFGYNEIPGKVVARLFDNSMIIKCRDNYIRLIEYEKE